MPQRETIRRLAVLGLILLVVASFLPVAIRDHNYFDLKIYHGAVQYWLRDHGNLYAYTEETGYGFTYPPFAALLMAPIAYIPFAIVRSLMSVGTAVAAAALVWKLLNPVMQRQGWPRWYAYLIALLVVTIFDPLRETYSFGQVNMLLLGFVAVDVLILLASGSRYAGIGIGLATAIKLTPGIFILWLLLTRQWRAAAVAIGTAGVATLGAAAVSPSTSRDFWFGAFLDTGRVGTMHFVANQSIAGFVIRLSSDHWRRVWAGLVLVVLLFWAWRCLKAAKAGDLVYGFALTGIVGALISPVTWSHHLVWLLPAFLLVLDRAFAAPARSLRRRLLLAVGATAYLVMASRVIWLEAWHTPGWPFLGANAYFWGMLALLVVIPVAAPAARPRAAGATATDGGTATVPKQRTAVEPATVEPATVEPATVEPAVRPATDQRESALGAAG